MSTLSPWFSWRKLALLFSALLLLGTGLVESRQQPLPQFLLDTMPEEMIRDHGMIDNLYTAIYESWLQGAPLPEIFAGATTQGPGGQASIYGSNVRMSNPSFAGSQNEFQIAINPVDSRFAIGTSNDSRMAGVGIYRTEDGGLTWTAQDAPIGTRACCDPSVAYGSDGVVYVGVLSTSPAGQWTLRSTDNGLTWERKPFAPLPDRPNLAVDPRDSNIVYITYSDLPGSNRIKGYRSTDGGTTWGSSFFIGAPAPPLGYEQSSQPRVASDGTLYVGYQQYLNQSLGCSAGVQNVLAKSTDAGASFTYTVFDIVQGGTCTPAQAGRGIFCINSAGQNFRSRSHPILGVDPDNPDVVYMVYSGGDLESDYVCAGASGHHSDILFRKSVDGGATFSDPSKVNQDGMQGVDQYYPWMEVSESGVIWVGWNDRRDDPNNFRSLWYQAFSYDGGATWVEEVVGDQPTQPSTFIGDYHGLAAKNDRVMGMWFDSRVNASGDPFTSPLGNGTLAQSSAFRSALFTRYGQRKAASRHRPMHPAFSLGMGLE